MTETPSNFDVARARCSVSALTLRPDDARCLFVLGHGAGAGMTHRFLQAYAEELAARGVATFRYQFPYMESGRKYPDRRPALLATVQAAIEAARAAAGDLPIFAGGKSMGGRMTSMLAAETEDAPDGAGATMEAVRGLIFVGFPLHPSRKPGTERSGHLFEVRRPMLFLQGTRDTLAELDLLRPICTRLGDAATLHIIDGGDHSFHVLKRSGRTDDEAMAELAETTATWTEAHSC